MHLLREVYWNSDGSRGLPGEDLAFLPEVLLHVQAAPLTFGRQSKILQERGLMFAVLQEALEDYKKYRQAEDPDGKRLFDDAELWIFRKSRSWWPFSFERVCQELDIEPGYIRRKLRRGETPILLTPTPGSAKPTA